MRVIASYTLSNQAHKVTVLLCRQCGSRKTVPVCLSHLCQPVVTDGDGSTPALRACHDSHDKAHRASGQPAPLSPKYRPLVLCTSRESPKSDPVCFLIEGQYPDGDCTSGRTGIPPAIGRRVTGAEGPALHQSSEARTLQRRFGTGPCGTRPPTTLLKKRQPTLLSVFFF